MFEKQSLGWIVLAAIVTIGYGAYQEDLARHIMWPLTVDAYNHGVQSCINATLGTEYEVSSRRSKSKLISSLSVWCPNNRKM